MCLQLANFTLVNHLCISNIILSKQKLLICCIYLWSIWLKLSVQCLIWYLSGCLTCYLGLYSRNNHVIWPLHGTIVAYWSLTKVQVPIPVMENSCLPALGTLGTRNREQPTLHFDIWKISWTSEWTWELHWQCKSRGLLGLADPCGHALPSHLVMRETGTQCHFHLSVIFAIELCWPTCITGHPHHVFRIRESDSLFVI